MRPLSFCRVKQKRPKKYLFKLRYVLLLRVYIGRKAQRNAHSKTQGARDKRPPLYYAQVSNTKHSLQAVPLRGVQMFRCGSACRDH